MRKLEGEKIKLDQPTSGFWKCQGSSKTFGRNRLVTADDREVKTGKASKELY